MGIIGLPLAMIALVLIVIFAVTFFRSVRREKRGISKDSAEDIALRRFRNARPIAAGFKREQNTWVWEFEVLEGQDIYSVWVDALTGRVLKAQNIRSGRPYVQANPRMLGRRIG